MVKLEGKCLKYSTSITEEIFDQIVIKLRKIGYIRKSSNQNDYTGFLKFESIFFDDNAWDTRHYSDEPFRDSVPLHEILAISDSSEPEGILIYEDSITSEIFDKIIQTLEDRGVRGEGSCKNYAGFKTYGGLYINPRNWQTCVYTTDDYDENRLYVSDIIGSYSAKTVGFPFKVGDTIRCDRLNIWSSHYVYKSPIVICEGKEVVIEKISSPDSDFTVSFQANYKGESYGFAYNADNSYSLVRGLSSSRVQRDEERVAASIVSFSTPDTVSKPIMITVPKI